MLQRIWVLKEKVSYRGQAVHSLPFQFGSSLPCLEKNYSFFLTYHHLSNAHLTFLFPKQWHKIMSPCSAGAVKLAILQNNDQRKWIVVLLLQQWLSLCGAISKTKGLDQHAILMKSRVHKWKITWKMFYFLLALLFTNTKRFTTVSRVKSQKSLALEFWECDIHQWSHRKDHLPLSQISTPDLLYFNFIFKQKGTIWDLNKKEQFGTSLVV